MGLHLLTASAIQVSALQAAQSKMRYAGRLPKRGMKLRSTVACPHFSHGGSGLAVSSVGMASRLSRNAPSTTLHLMTAAYKWRAPTRRRQGVVASPSCRIEVRTTSIMSRSALVVCPALDPSAPKVKSWVAARQDELGMAASRAAGRDCVI